MKISYTNPDGTTILVDQREFYAYKDYYLKYIRERAHDLIISVAPEYKQRNAALGLLSEEEANYIKTHIQNIRAISNEKEAQLEAITWDGDPATHAAACDLLETITWD